MAKKKRKEISEMTEDEIIEAIEDGRLIFDDKAFIKNIEEQMSPEQKEDPLFIAYKASVTPEEEQTPKDRYYLKVFEMAFDMTQYMGVRKDNRIGFVSEVEPAANAAFDSLRDHVDKLHQEYEKMTGRKFAKPKWREK